MNNSSPSLNFSPASVVATAIDQLPDPSTMAVFPPVRVAPLSKARVIVEPTVPVPVTLNPAVFSAALTTLSPAIALIVVAVGTVVSSVIVVVLVPVLPA